jgi:hypothetical protein
MAYFEQTSVTNQDKAVINPSTEEAVILLRRLVKFFETQSATDSAQRQRITVDAITGSLTLATITTVSAVTAITNALPAGTNAIGAITNIALQFGWNQQMFADPARTAYNTGIRQHLTFT